MKQLFGVIRLATYIVLIANQIMGFASGPVVILLAIATVIFLCYDAYETISAYRLNRQKEKKQDR